MTSFFVIAVPLGGVIAGPISGLILDGMQGVGGLRGWQRLFLAEGLPAILLGFAAYFYLPDRPAGAGWLSSEEKRTIEQDLAADRAAALKTTKEFLGRAAGPKGLPFVIHLFRLLLFFEYNFALGALAPEASRCRHRDRYRLPQRHHLDCVGGRMVAIGYSSDRLMERRWHVALCGFVASGCFLLLPLAAGSVAVTVDAAGRRIYRHFQHPQPVLDDPEWVS